jgi:2-keto-4-pentenoate hydratase/2-oxohepta-3-ene-1,7-dioic acid hydratase in catechol pathway
MTRLVSYAAEPGAPWRAGIVAGDDVVDVARLAARVLGASPGAAPSTVRDLLALGADAVGAVAAAAAGAAPGEVAGRRDALRLGPPVPDPDKILCIGLNYAAHAHETSLEAPPAPTVFAKFRNSLIGSGDPVRIPAAAAERVDYEGELAVVIGRRCRDVGDEDALAHVAGVMPLNDVSARDLQLATSQWTVGKAVDSFAPCGPELVLLDEVADLQALTLTTRLNGKVVQHASTSLMLFPVATIVAFLSRTMTLEPGDVIATGTPEGVGFTREPPLLLGPGDEVEVEIEGIGLLRNPVEAEVPAAVG